MKKLHNLKKSIMGIIVALVLCLMLDAINIALLAVMDKPLIVVIILWILIILPSVVVTVWVIIELIINVIHYNKQLDIVLSNIDKILNLEEKDSNDKT